MADLSRFLGLGTDHETGGVAQRHDRDAVGIAELKEPGALVSAVGIDGTTQMSGVVRHDPNGSAFDPGKHGDDRTAEGRAQFKRRALVGEDLDGVTNGIDPLAVLRDNVAHPSLVWFGPR